MLCGMGALASNVMVGIARAVDAGNITEAVRLQNVFIRIFHGVYGIDLSAVWVGQKYALTKLGLIATPYTAAQEMSARTPEAKKRIEVCVEQYRRELD
ncbi:hypothetical protein SDC9_212931 [bioreactor metagenome]|uniref:N-acetylneuraminate lyase n=1 Tax=bioreactor metagenome TaxID=1076179 RepID=A0A645JPC4_9ZZZZ